MPDHIERRLVALRSASTIEECAHEIHLEIWNCRRDLFPGRVIAHPFELVEPAVALYMKGFDVQTDSTLGEMWEDGRRVLVAGVVDNPARLVRVSPALDNQQRRYTTGHELGHVVRHPGMSLHRDRAISGHVPRKDVKEREADYFASCFLMPARHVIEQFYLRFGSYSFSMNEDVVFGLSLGSVSQVQNRIKRQRDASLLVATASSYMGLPFQPLCNFFKVSPWAMAIRLEEVGIVDEASVRWLKL